MLLPSKHLLSCYFYNKIPNYKCLHGHCLKQKDTFFKVCTYVYYEIILLPVKRNLELGSDIEISLVISGAVRQAQLYQRWGGSNISTVKHQVTSVSIQNEQPSKPSVEKCDFTEDTQHHTGRLSGALGDHLIALDDHHQHSPAPLLSAHELLQVEGGGRTLQAALSFSLCSYSMLVTLHTVI